MVAVCGSAVKGTNMRRTTRRVRTSATWHVSTKTFPPFLCRCLREGKSERVRAALLPLLLARGHSRGNACVPLAERRSALRRCIVAL